MKKILLATLITPLILTAAFAEVKIGFIDSNRLENEYNEYKSVKSEFDRLISAWQDSAEAMEEEITSLQQEYQTQRYMLSEEKKQETERIIQDKLNAYQNFRLSVFGTGGLAEQKYSEMTAPLLENIQKALEEIAEEYGYTLILDRSSGAIGYIDESLDVTDILLEKLNKGTKSGK
ncbi:OmpH family outer membrane protein [bacterium]|nr:OmpH family outer membrane protein [bacterium]